MDKKLENIIHNFLAGNGGDEEKKVLESWASESSENLEELRKLKEIKSTLTDVAKLENVNVEAAENIVFNKKKDQKRKWIWLIIAAILLMGTYTGYKYYTKSNIINTNVHFAEVNALEFKLSDETNIQLGLRSRLIEKGLRTTTLDGYAHFDVVKNQAKPFTIKLNNGEIVVLGTAFVVFSKGEEEEIYVEEGKVRYTVESISTIIEAGDYVKLVNGDIVKTQDVPLNMRGFDEFKLKYENHSFIKVIRDLEKKFAVDIDYDTLKKEVSTWTITADFSGMNLEEILEEIEVIFNISTKYKDLNSVVFTK